jgi:GntR family transcriptional regulator / MocR family aminotransferase
MIEVISLDDIVIDRQSNLQDQLYRGVVNKIVKGELRQGVKLPSSRLLAKDLKISRNTVIKTYDQLCDEGYLMSKLGSGIFVNADCLNHSFNVDENNQRFVYKLPSLSSFADSLNINVESSSKNLPFSPGLTALDEFPFKIWQQIFKRHTDRKYLYGYDDPNGYLPLREALVDYLAHSRGVKCKADQVIITQGAQQAITLCAQVLVDPGQQVLIEEPGYRSANSAFQALGANIKPVPLHNNRLNVSYLRESQLANASVLYCTPTHQYPMGGILPAGERMELLSWAVENNTWIIEDDYDSEFHFDQKPVASIQGLADEAPIVYLGSFSKTMFPGLRLGYLVVPKQVSEYFSSAKSATCGESNLLTQAVLADFIKEGHFTRHIRRMRQSYHKKWLHFRELLNSLSPRCKLIAESAGMHLVLEIGGIDDSLLSGYLQMFGFSPSPLSAYYKEESKKTGLVLGFANTSKQQREELVEHIRQFLK